MRINEQSQLILPVLALDVHPNFILTNDVNRLKLTLIIEDIGR